MEKKKSFKKTAFREWFSSYLLMLIIPLFFFVIFVFSSIGIISKEVEYYNSKSVEYVSKLFDSMFQQMNSLCDEIIVNANLKDFIQIKKVEDINPYDLYIASDSFLSIALPKNQLELVFLYSPDLDYYIDPFRFGTLNSISDYSEGNLQYDYDDIDRVFRSKNRKTEVYDASYENASGTRINRILITRPLSFASRDGFYVAAIVKIDTIIGKEEGYDAFRRLMLFSSVDSSFIYDLSGANEEEHPSSLEDLMEGKQKNEIIASRKSNVSNFIYAIKIDKKEYFRPIYLIYVLIAVYLVVAILFGFLIMGSKVRRNWKTLSEALARSGGGTFDENADSIYSPFVSSVNKLSEEKQGLELILHSQTESLKKSMFDKILNSSENASIVSQNALKECGIDFLSDSFIIFLASSSDIEKAEEAVIERFSCDDIKVFPYGSHYGAAFILSLSSRYA
ncbi:MAG: hypothetical protein SPJ34_09300, partial [Candidatus Ornithospirochaeta sp.]|nr:hypothetical protein [Candidatus Ornithospirochaeta sp.]